MRFVSEKENERDPQSKGKEINTSYELGECMSKMPKLL